MATDWMRFRQRKMARPIRCDWRTSRTSSPTCSLCGMGVNLRPRLRLPNGSRLSCGRLARRRKGVDDSPCPPGHNAPLPLKRSPPGSFKRLLGRTPSSTTALDVFHGGPAASPVHRDFLAIGLEDDTKRAVRGILRHVNEVVSLWASIRMGLDVDMAWV